MRQFLCALITRYVYLYLPTAGGDLRTLFLWLLLLLLLGFQRPNNICFMPAIGNLRQLPLCRPSSAVLEILLTYLYACWYTNKCISIIFYVHIIYTLILNKCVSASNCMSAQFSVTLSTNLVHEDALVWNFG